MLSTCTIGERAGGGEPGPRGVADPEGAHDGLVAQGRGSAVGADAGTRHPLGGGRRQRAHPGGGLGDAVLGQAPGPHGARRTAACTSS